MLSGESGVRAWADSWDANGDVAYLNHGSFGRAPKVVLEAQARWTAELQRNPMDFFTRRLDGYFDAAAEKMSRFVGCKAGDLVFVPNASAGMNIVAANVTLDPD